MGAFGLTGLRGGGGVVPSAAAQASAVVRGENAALNRSGASWRHQIEKLFEAARVVF